VLGAFLTLTAQGAARNAPAASAVAAPDTTTGAVPTDSIDSFESQVAELRARNLVLPVEGVAATDLRDAFDAPRGDHVHRAIDILAPRNTPVLAVEDGTIARVYPSNGGGGIAIYQFDPTGRYAYYYAHLERWADAIAVGDPVTRGQVIGYVGTSGNAPPNTPHLHFAITRLGDDRRWWTGSPLNPYLVFAP
jgi:murein DD-endopeptidase MepM/ murein hydrolase activator NlpD